MDDVLKIIGRAQSLFEEDVQRHENEIKKIVEASRFLVIGGAGSIGQAVVRELFKKKRLSLACGRHKREQSG